MLCAVSPREDFAERGMDALIESVIYKRLRINFSLSSPKKAIEVPR